MTLFYVTSEQGVLCTHARLEEIRDGELNCTANDVAVFFGSLFFSFFPLFPFSLPSASLFINQILLLKMGESRTELLAWMNDLLQLNYTKVEQAGTGKSCISLVINQFVFKPVVLVRSLIGAAYSQIMDSIFSEF